MPDASNDSEGPSRINASPLDNETTLTVPVSTGQSMRTPYARGYSGVGFWPNSAGDVVNIFSRNSRITSAGLFFDGSFIFDMAFKHPENQNGYD
jgi:hypothetical protein